jgi:hypothetical protein
MSERRRPKASGKGEGTSTCYSRASDADSRQAYVWEDVYTAEVGSLWKYEAKILMLHCFCADISIEAREGTM